VIRPAQMIVETLVAQLCVLIDAIDRFDAEIDAISRTLPDNGLFASFPGAGHIQAPRLLVAFGEDRDRFASATEVQRYAGIAPVVERSGNRCWVHYVSPARRSYGKPLWNGLDHDIAVVLGWRLLLATAQKGVLSWGRRSSLGVQVDPDSV
jgi:hypothetical protein